VGRKKSKAEAPDKGSIEIDRLDPDLQKMAKHLGFRERASVHKIGRGIETERRTEVLSAAFAAVTGFFGLAALVYSVVGPSEKRGQMQGVGIFIALWALLAFVYSLRARKRLGEFRKLESIVKEKLGLT